MARIRSIHPRLFTDEAYVALSMAARVMLPGLWTEAFDDGVFEWKPLTLKMRLFPADAVDMVALLNELVEVGWVRRFEHAGKLYGVLRNFQKWQRPKKPTSSGVLPVELAVFAGAKSANNDGEHLRDGSEPVPDEYRTGGEPVGNQYGTGSEPVPNWWGTGTENVAQKGGREEGRKVYSDLRSGRAEGPPRPPDASEGISSQTASAGQRSPPANERTTVPLFPEPPPDPPGAPDQRGELFRVGLSVVRGLTGKGGSQCRSLFGRWLKRLDDDCAVLSAILARAEECRPADPVPWIESAISARLRPSSRSYPAAADGAEAWAPWAETFEDYRGQRHPVVCGQFIDRLVEDVCEAAGLPPTWNDWGVLLEWLRDGIDPHDTVLPVMRRVSSRRSEPPRSLAFFDKAVRDIQPLRGAA